MGPSIITVIKSLSSTSLPEIKATICLGYTFLCVWALGGRKENTERWTRWKSGGGSKSSTCFWLVFFF